MLTYLQNTLIDEKLFLPKAKNYAFLNTSIKNPGCVISLVCEYFLREYGMHFLELDNDNRITKHIMLRPASFQAVLSQLLKMKPRIKCIIADVTNKDIETEECIRTKLLNLYKILKINGYDVIDILHFGKDNYFSVKMDICSE